MDNQGTNISLEGMTPAQLKELQKETERQMQRIRGEKVKEVRDMIKEMAQENDLSIEEIIEPWAKKGKNAGRKKRGGTVPPKYRNPGNPSETWTGRGKKPAWVEEAIAAGQSLESMLIEK